MPAEATDTIEEFKTNTAALSKAVSKVRIMIGVLDAPDAPEDITFKRADLRKLLDGVTSAYEQLLTLAQVMIEAASKLEPSRSASSKEKKP